MGRKPLESSNLFPSAILRPLGKGKPLKLGSSRRREKQKRRQRLTIGLIKWSFLLGLVLAAGIYAWYTGSSVARREVTELEKRTGELTEEVTELQSQLGESRGREAVLEKQLPTVSEKAFLSLARQRVEEGVSLDRLSEVIAAASATRDCEGAPESKRFRVRTPIADPTGSAASFEDATLTVTAEGAAAVDADGRPEAWFDADQPITITILHVNGAVARVEGMLPLTHALAVGNTEYRFQFAAAGLRGFLQASMDRCAYP